jgi:urocanate hydratase
VSHAPVRKDILSVEEKKLAIRNALRYFPKKWHAELSKEFAEELKKYGRVYMHRFKPSYKMYARPISEYPGKSVQAKSIMLMIHNNLDPAVAQHPDELITYGGNGAVFQNWAQYLVTMHYLTEMTDEQTLTIYSGHPMGLYPSNINAPRVVVTNGMMIPNYSKPDDWEKYNALGVTQYGQMTAGSYMYIGPQGIVHGTTITILNAGRKISKNGEGLAGKLFVTSGLGGMSGAQPKAGNIAGCVTVCAEINKEAATKRHEQGWVDEIISDIQELCARVKKAKENKEIVSIAFVGNIVSVWETFEEENIYIDLGSDQTSLHNPWAGGYYPVALGFQEANKMMTQEPAQFKEYVHESLRRQVTAINKHTKKGTYFFDYGNAFLLESSRAVADIMGDTPSGFKYPSYIEDIMGPMCFDFGFGPFRWVCTSAKPEDLLKTDQIAIQVLE